MLGPLAPGLPNNFSNWLQRGGTTIWLRLTLSFLAKSTFFMERTYTRCPHLPLGNSSSPPALESGYPGTARLGFSFVQTDAINGRRGLKYGDLQKRRLRHPNCRFSAIALRSGSVGRR